jgi:AcrR family transcriptional regulator
MSSRAAPAASAETSSHPREPEPAAAPTVVTTRDRLLRAAETLFAQKGIAYTPAREIVRAAGQRNESALQYHFGGLTGLIDALWAERGSQVNVEREAMTAGLLAARGDSVRPDARQLCALALLPAVRLARRDPRLIGATSSRASRPWSA